MNTADFTCLKMVYDNIHTIRNNDNDKDKDNWYNRVYLCFEDKLHNSTNPINGFYCFKYYSLENANKGLELRRQIWDNKNKETNIRYTLIPICKWVPPILILDRIILNWKLKNLFWLGNHKLMDGINIKK